MRISGVMPLRNAVRLGYPFDLAVGSLQRLCAEVVVLVDPTSEDDTVKRVRALGPDRIVESVWDMGNHAGHVHGEIAKQTTVACTAVMGDWISSLQADEVLHEVASYAVDEFERRRKTFLWDDPNDNEPPDDNEPLDDLNDHL